MSNKNRNGRQRHFGLQSWSCFGNKSPRSSMLLLLDLHRFCTVLVNSAHGSNTRGCSVLKLRFRTSILYRSSWRQTFYVQDRTDSCILEIHPFDRVVFSFRNIVYSRHKCCISCPSSVSSVKEYCPFSTIFKPASKHSLDNFWSSDNNSNLRSQSRTRFHPLLFVGMGSSNRRAGRNLHRFQMIRCFKFPQGHRIFGYFLAQIWS